MDSETAYRIVEDGGIVAVLRGAFPANVALRAAEALVDEGIRAVELTTNSPDAFAAMQAIRRAHGPEVAVGMGTVLDADAACRALDAGADMIVAPSFSPDVVRLARERDVLAVPGVITPTEAVNAWALGVRLLKVFPIGPLGVEYFRALRAPLDHMRFICNGGTDDTNVAAFLRAGAVACGVAGWLTGDGTWPPERIRERARRLRAAVDEARSGV